ncbi:MULTISPECIES: hypothetical protein [unclassified Nocardioides]|uniref:hypothetical protein n=1 Tax=unclassified Nocardioides TaxID=2615069 RepID=UPI0036098EC0
MDFYEVSEDEQQRMERLLRRHRKRLLGFPNVHDVDFGFEFTDGAPSGRLALRVHVDRKRSLRGLKVADRVPDEIDGVPVDVIEFTPEEQAIPRTAVHVPVRGGVRLANVMSAGGGTLGMIVFDRDTLQPLAISNNHVMNRTPDLAPAVRGDLMSQPGPNQAPDVLGPVTRLDVALDCAVCSIGNRAWTLDMYGVGDVTGWAPAQLGKKVMKSGLTTGVTWGVIDGMNSGGFTIVPDTSVPASGQMSLPGDSGSIWMELTTNRAVGLHFAGNTTGPERASAKHLDQVMNKLNVLVFDGAAIGRAVIGSACRVRARTAPGATCSLSVVYPSGRRSSAKGLGTKTADTSGWVEWTWFIGTHTKRVGAGTGSPLGFPIRATVSFPGGGTRLLERPLEGTTSTS